MGGGGWFVVVIRGHYLYFFSLDIVGLSLLIFPPRASTVLPPAKVRQFRVHKFCWLVSISLVPMSSIMLSTASVSCTTWGPSASRGDWGSVFERLGSRTTYVHICKESQDLGPGLGFYYLLGFP